MWARVMETNVETYAPLDVIIIIIIIIYLFIIKTFL